VRQAIAETFATKLSYRTRQQKAKVPRTAEFFLINTLSHLGEFLGVALPRDGAEVSDSNGLKKSLGGDCLIALQSVSERLPKPAL
jgi:hypothetical protein